MLLVKKILLGFVNFFRYLFALMLLIMGLTEISNNYTYGLTLLIFAFSVSPLIRVALNPITFLNNNQKNLAKVLIPIVLLVLVSNTDEFASIEKSDTSSEEGLDLFGLNRFKLLKNTDTLELGTEFVPDQYYNTEKFEDVLVEGTVNKNQVGAYVVVFTYEETVKNLTLKYVDTTPPKVTRSRADIYVNEKLSASDLVNVADFTKTSVTFIEEPDWDKTGETNVKVLAVDEFDNKTEFEFTINVSENPDDLIKDYFTEASVWMGELGALVHETRTHFGKFDNSTSWNKEMDSLYARFMLKFDEYTRWEVPEGAEGVHAYIDSANVNYIYGLNSLMDGIDNNDPEQVELLTSYWELATIYLEYAVVEAEEIGMSLNN